MKFRIVSSLAVARSPGFSWAAETYLHNLCVVCNHGEGQHQITEPTALQKFRGKTKRSDRHQGACTEPGCNCQEYNHPKEVLLGLS